MPRGVYDRTKKPEPVSAQSKPVAVLSDTDWPKRKGWQPFGDRLGFLSLDRQHLNTGRLRIQPPRNPELRDRPKT